jgi:hypothetical protein
MYRLDNGVVWYGIRAQSPLAERFPMPTTSPNVQCDQSLSFSSNSNRMFKVYDGQRVRYVQNSAVAGPDMYMYSRCMQGDPPPIYFNNDD